MGMRYGLVVGLLVGLAGCEQAAGSAGPPVTQAPEQDGAVQGSGGQAVEEPGSGSEVEAPGAGVLEGGLQYDGSISIKRRLP